MAMADDYLMPWPGECRWADDPGVCCLAMCCPCIIAGQNAEVAGLGPSGSVSSPVAFAVILRVIGYQLVSSESTFVALLGQMIFCTGHAAFVGMLFALRRKLAMKYMLEPDACPSILWNSCCCTFVPLVQESKVVRGESRMVRPVHVMQPGVQTTMGQPVRIALGQPMGATPVVMGTVVQGRPVVQARQAAFPPTAGTVPIVMSVPAPTPASAPAPAPA